MNIKRTIISIIALILILIAVIVSACANPKFEVMNLDISPDPVGAGDEATITVEVTNTGNAAGSYTATLKISNDTIETKDILLEPGATEKVSFTVMKNETGIYDINIGILSGNLNVVTPARLELGFPVLTPTEVLPSESSSIEIDARNTGEVEGTFEVSLMVNGEKSQTKEVTIDGGETTIVSFNLALETPGKYDIGIDGFKESLKVLKPAQFQLSSLRFSPTEAVARQEIIVEVDVFNSGEVEGIHTLSLEVNGKKLESKEVKVRAGDTLTASFVLINDFGGNYQISVNELTGNLIVSGPRYGGRLTLVNPWNIEYFDEIISDSPESALTLQLTNEELIRGDWTKGLAGGYGTGETTWTLPLDNGEYSVGYIAESWRISEPGTIVFQIRKGIHYALNRDNEASSLVNGRELTAEDVVFSLKRAISDQRSHIYRFHPALRQALISAIDEWIINIRVQPDVALEALQYFGDFVSIVPPEVVTKYGDMSDWRNSVGTGPFILSEYVAGNWSTLERNYNYWMKDPVGLGMGNQLPYVESVRILIIPDASVRQAALRTGKIDQLLSLPGDDPAYIQQRTPDLMSIKVDDNSDPMSSLYNFWWPWVKNYNGELTIGYYNSIWPQYIWIDQDLKKAMGY